MKNMIPGFKCIHYMLKGKDDVNILCSINLLRMDRQDDVCVIEYIDTFPPSSQLWKVTL